MSPFILATALRRGFFGLDTNCGDFSCAVDGQVRRNQGGGRARTLQLIRDPATTKARKTPRLRRTRPAARRLPKHFDFDQGGALAGEVESLGGGVREVEDTVAGCGEAVVDGDADGFAVAQIGNTKFCAAAERGVGGSELRGGIDAAAGGFVAVERSAVEGGIAALGCMLSRLGRGSLVGNGWLGGGRFLQWSLRKTRGGRVGCT